MEVSSSMSAAIGEDPPEQMLSPGTRLFQSPRFNCHIIAIIGCKTKIDPEIIKQGLSQTLLKHPRFSSKLVETKGFFGRKKWVQTTVNLNDHVFAPTLDSNPDSPETFIQNYISNLTTNPLDQSKPLWELHILNIKTSECDAVAILRVHHSIGDGASLISLLLACTRQTADPTALPTIPSIPKKKSPEVDGCLRRVLWPIWLALTLIWNTVVGATAFTATILFLKDTETPIKGPRGVEATTKRFVHRSISLGDIKFAKNAMKVTINDVLLGVTQAGLSRYLNRRYGEKEKNIGNKNKKDYLPKRIRLNATVLVNLRPTIGIQALADMMAKKSKGKWGNLLGYLLLPFDIALQDDPLEYVRRAKSVIDRKKHSYEALCTYICCQLLLTLFGVEITAALARRAISNTTISFSNMAGPLEEVSFYGHQIAYLAPSVYGHPQALTIHFQSYADKMTIAMAVDPDVFPDPEQLFDDFEDSMKLIKEAVINQGLNKETV